MVTQEIIVGIVVAVVGGLILAFVKSGLAVTKKHLRRGVELLRGIFRLPKRIRLLIYLSSGGTCRDPMAKVITEQILKKMSLPFKVKIEAMALGPIEKTTASYGAKNAIKEIYGEDLLTDHRPQVITREVLDKADLVLVMDRSLLKSIKKSTTKKIYLFKEFFGLSGDVVDPYPDGNDDATLSRYRKCAEEMKTILDGNFNRLIRALHA
jgi:protein-tyrosine phosphatase